MKATLGTLCSALGLLALLVTVCCGQGAEAQPKSWTGFEIPESVLVDSVKNGYWVSNIGPAPADPKAKDNNGSLSFLDIENDKVTHKQFAGGQDGLTLNAPKGMVLVDRILWVTDIDTVRRFDLQTNKALEPIDLSTFQPAFMNDLCRDGGSLYATDSGKGQVFHIETKTGTVTKLADVEGANGCAIHPKTHALTVVSTAGKVVRIGTDGKVSILLAETKKGLDGAEYAPDGTLYFSSCSEGEVYRWVEGEAKAETIHSGYTNAADITLDFAKKRLLIPTFNGNTVVMEPLP